MSKLISIYALCDPDTEEVRYVGKTNNIKVRASFYRSTAHSEAMFRWFLALEAQGKRPLMRILETVSTEQWENAERRWIAHYGMQNLLNQYPGGRKRKMQHTDPNDGEIAD